MVILLFGENNFLSHQKLLEYKERYSKKYGSQGNLQDLDLGESDDIDWEASIKSESLFAPVRLVIYRRALEKLPVEKQENVRAILAKNSAVFTDKNIVVIFWEEKIPKKNNPLFKLLTQKAKLENYPKLEGQKLISFLCKRLKILNSAVTFSKEGLNRLISYTAGDFNLLENEINKLASFKESGEITTQDIELIVSSSLASTIFDTIEATASGNKKSALRLLHEQLINKEDPFYILSMYAYQFRNLLRISDLYWKGINNKFELAKQTRIHPYVIQKATPQIKNFTPEKLKKIYARIQKIDRNTKTGNTDIVLAIDNFLMSI